MYTYEGVSYTINQIQEAAKKSNMSVDDYVKKIKADTKTEPTKDVESAGLLDSTTFQTDAATGAGVVSQPMTASQAGYVEAGDTGSPLEDTSSELQDPDPDKPLSASEKRIATRKKREQEKQDRLKAEAISA